MHTTPSITFAEHCSLSNSDRQNNVRRTIYTEVKITHSLDQPQQLLFGDNKGSKHEQGPITITHRTGKSLCNENGVRGVSRSSQQRHKRCVYITRALRFRKLGVSLLGLG